jgi:hypothetical protein
MGKTNMDNIISEYQKWKQQGETLRSQARHAMESRFRELLSEAARISQEYQHDFGSVLKPPPGVTAFRYKATIKPKAKKPAKGKAAAPAAPATPPSPPAKADPKVTGIEKKLVTAKKKLDAAKTAGAPTRNLEDRIYELEDELRLASQGS